MALILLIPHNHIKVFNNENALSLRETKYYNVVDIKNHQKEELELKEKNK